MSLLLAWLIFPLVMLVLCLGCGLLVDRISGRIVAGALLAPVGLAAVVVIAGLLTMQTTSARFATPVCAAAAFVGLVSGRERLRNATPNRWLIAAGLGVFLAYGAPVLMSGSATFAGYIKLDDTATWLALTDRVMDHGRSLSGIAPSTHFATLDYTLARGYPLGSLLPWGVGRGAGWPRPGVADPALSGVPRRDVRADRVDAVGAASAPAVRRGCGDFYREPAGTALRILALGWDQGADGRTVHRPCRSARSGVGEGAGQSTPPRNTSGRAVRGDAGDTHARGRALDHRRAARRTRSLRRP